MKPSVILVLPMLRTASIPSSRLLTAIACLCLACFNGCDDSGTKRLQEIQARQSQGQERRDAIREAFRYLPQLIRLDRSAALREIRYQLNTWSKSVSTPPEWKSASLLESIPASMRTIDFSKRMTKLEFGEPECEFLLQSQMLKEATSWVLELPYRDRLFAPWLEAQKASLTPDEWNQLETTLKLFDWVVCNVRIEGQAKDVERLPTNADMPVDDRSPHCRQLPWQTMMFARGEAWQRARLFTQMAFIRGIDSIVLALPSETGATENASIRLWCIGVPIGNEIYLFEPRWGLPFPSQSTNGIATLKEARSNPAVLRRAKLPGRFEYPVESKDLDNLIALIDVEPFSVGRTMYTLERSLTGDNRVRLSIDADAFEERLLKLDPKLSVRLWNVPWLAHYYNESTRKRLTEFSPFSMAYMETFGAYIIDNPISRVRILHFKGQFDSTVEASGALRTYMDIRIDEQTLKELEDNREVQKALGVEQRPNEDSKQFKLRIEQAQQAYRRSKFDVAMFLAMANGDLGKLDTTEDWLTRRLLDLPGTEQWHAHAHYLLGRNYEAKNNPSAAIEQYKFENSPQEAGNRIRIRKIEAQESAGKEEASSAGSSSTSQ